MTAFDRVERRLPELIDDLGAAGMPDYVDDLLRTTARTRQRPAWSALERWLPMGVIARPVPIRPMPWRLIAIVALVVLVAAATLVYVGTQQRRLPPPFGLAENGALVISTADGDIVTVDAVSGRTSPLIAGPTIDVGPFFSFDGQWLFFDRRDAVETEGSLYVAKADGSDIRPLLRPDEKGTWFDFTPDTDRAIVVSIVAGKGGVISMMNLVDGSRVELPLDLDVGSATWRPNHEELVVTERPISPGDPATFWVVNADGSGTPRKIDAAANAINQPTLSPDGRLLAYSTWGPAQVHVVDIDKGGDHAITATDDADGDVWQSPQFAPDGTRIVVNRFVTNSDPVRGRLAIIPVDGRGAPIDVGPVTENPMPGVLIAPDGKSGIAAYEALDKTLAFDMATGAAQEVPYHATNGSSWQRLAP